MALEELRSEIKEMKMTLRMVVNRLGANPSEISQDLPEGIHFPLKNSEELYALEIKLLNPDIEKQVVSIFFSHLFLY